MDPLELRRRNSARKGTRRADGTVYGEIGCEETVAAIVDSGHYRSAAPSGPNQGRGVASGFWFNGGGQSAATIVVATDGTVTLQEGSADIGGTRAAMAMIVAETLGLSADQVNPMVVDTDSIGYTDGTGGSRVCYATGHACYLAAEDVKEKMRLRAARQLEVEEEDVEFETGRFVCRSDSNKALTFDEVAAEQGSTGGPIEGTGCDQRFGSWQCLRNPCRRCRGRSRDRQGQYPPLHRSPGRRQGDPPLLRGGADSGRGRSGDRLGPDRGVFLR